MRHATVLLLVLSATSLAHAQAASSGVDPPLADAAPAEPAPERIGSPDRDLYLERLARHFFDRGMYYRAVGTLEELALGTDDARTRRYAREHAADAYALGGDFAGAASAYDEALAVGGWDASSEDRLRIRRTVARAEAARAGDATTLDSFAAELAPLVARSSGRSRAIGAFHRARFLAHDGELTLARASVREGLLACGDADAELRRELDALGRALVSPPPSALHPWVGAGLSAVLPGAGSIYAGHSIDAVYYLVLTAGPAALAWDVWDSERAFADQKTSFYVLGGFAALFYTLSIAEGYVQSARANEVRRFEWTRSLVDRADPTLREEPASMPDAP